MALVGRRAEDFWASIWDYFEVRASTPTTGSSQGEMPGAEWFTGARLNYAENLLAGKPDDRLAVQHASEPGARPSRGASCASRSPARPRRSAGSALRPATGSRPIAEHSRDARRLPATASIGAIWSSCSPDFGPGSVIDRFAQIEPKVLVCVDGYRYNGRDFDRRDVVADLLAAMPSVEHTVVLPTSTRPGRRGVSEPDRLERAARRRRAGRDRLRAGRLRPSALGPVLVRDHRPAEGDRPADGGILVEQLKKLGLHLDAQEGDRVFWFTTTGWMMWNFLVGVLLTDASIILYDGSPGHPDTRALGPRRERRDDLLRHQRSYVAAA